MLQLLENNGILTLGMDSRDIDWQRTWRTQLDKDDRPDEEGAPVCPHYYTPALNLTNLSAAQTHQASGKKWHMQSLVALCTPSYIPASLLRTHAG